MTMVKRTRICLPATLRPCAGILFLLAVACPASLEAGILTFEGFADGTSLTNQYSGLAFANATIISAGITLNEIEFPPHSGTNVVFDDGGPISINFASPILSFSGFFTYAVPLTLTGFDALNNPATSAASTFFSNLALSGDSGSTPNEFLWVSLAGGISRMTITGDQAGSSFVFDNATVTSAAVPEPGTWLLAVCCLWMCRRRK